MNSRQPVLKLRWPRFSGCASLPRAARSRYPPALSRLRHIRKLTLCGRVLQDEGFRPTNDAAAPLAQPDCLRKAHGER